ncbi:IS110 family transposase, partial [Streptomyces sp. NPDC004675]|uniref:IS110 family transposase n=1 Tax=Streptomyces sp. NPDC004675 TaxID=3154286 RepID=UPI0033B1C852
MAEIGDVHRFASADRLCSWAGLTPRHYESDTTVRRGHVTKQGSKLVRWAVVEAIQRKTTPKITEDRARIEARRGRVLDFEDRCGVSDFRRCLPQVRLQPSDRCGHASRVESA